MTRVIRRLSIRSFFRWYDLWIGAYWGREDWILYLCPLPMVGIRIAIPYHRTNGSPRKFGVR